MKTKQVRAPFVIAAAAAVACLLLFVIGYQLARQHVAESIADPVMLGTALDRLRAQFVVIGMLCTAAVTYAGWLLGRSIMRPFERLTSTFAAGGDLSDVTSQRAYLVEARALVAAVHRRENEQRALAADLRHSSARLSQMVSAVSEGLLHLDDSGRVVHANPAAIQLLALQQLTPRQHVVSLVRNVELRQLLTRAMSGEALHGEDVTIDERRLLINARPIPSARGAGTIHSGTVVSIADLTELRRLEGVRRDFVANVTHELKTPLTSIHGYTETLRSDDDMPVETRRQFLAVIERNAVRLQQLVDDLLDLARIESGGWMPVLREIDALAVIREAWEGCSDVPAAGRIMFEAPAGAVMVHADADGLKHAIANVLDNAVRYTPPGGRITVDVHRREGAHGAAPVIVIAVRDTGAGIPRDALRRIFERFYRVDPARARTGGGTGLGLAIVKHLIESMGGEVSATSELGRGSTISISLPAA